jgi:hypothetical protein
MSIQLNEENGGQILIVHLRVLFDMTSLHGLELPKIAAHLVHVQVKHFSELLHGGALRWLKEGTLVNP